MSHFQNILPKQTNQETRNLVRGATTSSSEADFSSPPKRVSTACSACKTRKSKCDGRQPCERCVRHKTECIIDEDEDLRRRRAVKRKMEDLEADRQLLVRLVAAIREHDDESIMPLLNCIRQSASLEEIKRCIESQSVGSPDPSSRSVQERAGETVRSPQNTPSEEPSQSRTRLDIGDLINGPASRASP